MRMVKLIIALAVLSLALMGWNCKDDEETQVIPEKYVGTWEADSTIEQTLIEIAFPDQSTDLRDVGAKVRAIIKKDGTYSLTFSGLFIIPDGTDQGKVTLDEENKVISFISDDPEVEPFILLYSWEDDILVLTTQYDFGEGLVGVTIKLAKSA